MLAAVDGVGGGTGAAGHRGRWAGLVVGGVVLAVLAVAGAFVTSPVAGAWVLAALTAALLLGGGAAAWVGRGATGGPTTTTAGPPAPPSAAAPPVRDVDDLQTFFDAPPGTADSPDGPDRTPVPAAGPATSPAPADRRPSPGVATAPDETHRTTVRRIAVGATAALLVVVVGAVVAAALTRDGSPRGGDGDGRGDREGSASPAETPVTSVPPASTAPSPLTAAAAGDLAGVAVSPGRDGLEAELAFEGIVLEPRAVGSTVTRPSLTLSADGVSGVAHLELPTWNCLSATAPADPAAAGCTPGPTEYADLGTPGLRVDVADGDFDLAGDFATYTRPNGSPPAYTGRTYAITVSGGPEGGTPDRETPATGELGLGGATTGTRTGSDLNLVRVSG